MRKFINLVALAALLFMPAVAMAQATLPQTMDFESGMGSWTTASTHSSSGISNTAAHFGSNSFRFYYSTTPPQYLISPELEVLTAQLQVEFWYKAYSQNFTESFQVGYSTTTNDPTSFTWGTEISTNNTDWQEYSDFVPAGTKYVAIKYTANDQFYLFIDDIFIGEPPTCFAVNGLTASNPTSDGISLSWTDTVNTGANYTVYYWKNGGDTTDVPGISTTSTTLTGLDAATEYLWYVVANCSATDNSIPSQNSTFRTDCLNGSCELTVTATAQYASWGSYYSPSAVVLQNGGALATVQGTQQVSVCSGDSVIITYVQPSYSYGSQSVTILDGGGTTVFNGTTTNNSTGDTIVILATPCPSCIPPMALHIDSVTIDEIYFSWTPRSGASQFIVYLGDSLVSENVTDTFYTFTNLSANTLYTVKVQSVCSTDDSSSIVGTNARTACGAMDLPIFVDFEDAAYNGAWYPCWDSTIHAGTDPSVNDQPGGSYSPTQHTPGGTYAMYLQGNSNENYNLVVGPEMNAVGNEINVSFWAMINNGWIKAGVITNPRDTSTFIPMVTITSGGWTEYEFNTSTLSASANYRVAWLACGNGYIGKFDDVSISEYTGCARPATASVGTVGARQVELSWNAVDGANGYTVYYGTVNDPTSSSLLTESATDTAFTLTGLQPETHYYAWVATNCGGNESDLRYAGSFTTLISCPTVNNLTVDTTTTDGATITWTAGDVETQWLVALDSNDFDLITDTFYTFSGLDAMTGHTVYVRAYCGDDDTSSISSINFATACADVTCNLTAYVTDSYNDSWNGCTIIIMQAGIQVGTIDCPSGQSGSTFTHEVCSTAPVSLVFNRGNYPNELGGYIMDGGGTTVFTISGMGNYNTGDVLATVNTPCPECVPPTNLAVDTVTATEATIYWTAQDGQSSWFVILDTNDAVVVTDTFYTFTSLDARTAHTAYVATDCNGDTSAFINVPFTTDCATGSCDVTVVMADSYGDGWNGNAIQAYQNGALCGSATITSGNSGTETINVCSGLPVEFRFHSGSYADEISFTIYDGGDTEIHTAAQGSMTSMADGALIESIANACPSCLTPTGVHASAIDSNSITFSWNYVDTLSAYLISFNGGAYTSNNTGSETYSGLTPNTAYTFSVRALCTADDTSAVRTITVKTTCGQMVVPYTESFENETQNAMPSCWTLVAGTGYDNYPGVSASAHTGSKALTLATAYFDSVTVATSLVPLGGDEIFVSFWASVNTGNTLYAGVMTDLAYDTTFIPLLIVPANNSTYTLYEFNTTTLPSYEQYYVAFRMVSSNMNHYIDLDDINIRQDDGCMTPSNLTATPTSTSVDLSWTNNSSMNNFVVDYRLANGTWNTAGNTTSTSYTINNLNSSSSYEARVGLICSNDTLWANVTFQTGCGLMAVPYLENFSTTAQGSMPPCWICDNNVDKYDGGAMWHTYTGDGSTKAVLPELDANITKLQITFDAKLGTISEGDAVMIGVADASGSFLAWIDTLTNPEQSREAFVTFTAYFPNYTMPLGAARVVFGHLLNTNNWFLIDNINIIELPDCYPVANLTGHNMNDPENTSFTWHPQGYATEWQVYLDTVTVGLDSIDNIADSNFITVTDTTYTIPIGDIQGGGIYNFFVRSHCGVSGSDWVKREFGAGTIIMNQSTVADTVTGCGFVVYDNGGPIAGYVPNSSSALVIRTENAGSQPQIFGGKFGWGSSPATLTVYDGEGTNGSVLFTYNTTDGRDTMLNQVLATSTTGSLTITFTVSGNMCHTGYELYVRCTDGAICPRPTELQAEMTSATQADVTWNGTAANYNFYYRISGSTTWVRQNVTSNNITLTGLVTDTVYDMYVVAICSATDSSSASVTRQLNTHYTVPVIPCDAPTNLSVSNITSSSALISWTAGGTETTWVIDYNGTSVNVNTNPYNLAGLTPNTNYIIKVKAVCDVNSESAWTGEHSFTTLNSSPQVTYYTVTVNANDPSMGNVNGGGTYAENTQALLTAIPNQGYHLVNWSNGSTAASISIIVTSDTTLTANFAADDPNVNYYTITLSANNPTWGSVTGAGTYEEGTVVEIKAISNTGYHFVNWNDNVTDSVRNITVTSDMNLVANFASNVGIEDVCSAAISLFPNPASSTVTLTGIESLATVTVVDMNGRVRGEWKVESGKLTIDVTDFAQGAYFVRIVGEQINTIRKLIVK